LDLRRYNPLTAPANPRRPWWELYALTRRDPYPAGIISHVGAPLFALVLLETLPGGHGMLFMVVNLPVWGFPYHGTIYTSFAFFVRTGKITINSHDLFKNHA
jgi:hypothetical protein